MANDDDPTASGGFSDRDFFELSLDHFCVAGFDGYWKRLNPSWMRTLGWTAQELMSRPLVEFVHPDDLEATLAARARLHEGAPLLSLTNRYRCRDGSYRWFAWRSVAHVARGLVYAVARDVTADKEAERALAELRESRERLQRQLRLADRMASVGTLAAGAAHEINNPLAYVLANLQLITADLRAHGDRGGWTERCLEMAMDAQDGAERIREIVRGLDTFSRARETRREVLDLHAVLRQAIGVTRNELRHRARLVEGMGPVPPIEADGSRLGQVFVNLLANAARAVPDCDADTHEVRVATWTDPDGSAIVEISDTGHGIPPDVMPRIFDPFFTTRPVGEGTGLGLSICHNEVTALGGQIAARNGELRGAVFRVTLPAAPGAPEHPRRPSTADGTAPRRATVLVVDDDLEVGTVIGRILRGHDVTVTTSAREALDLVLPDAPFDVVISDVMMPGMSGMELYEAVRRCRPDAAERFVFVTGGAFTASASAFLARVPNPRFDKPFDIASVRELVAHRAGTAGGPSRTG